MTGAGSAEFLLHRFRERDQTLTDNRDGTYVLWFEADLYDQLQVVQILARLDELNVAAERISLICIGEYPGIAHFGGLGELSAEQLRHLPSSGACSSVTQEALELSSRAWSAVRPSRPDGLPELLHSRNGVLRFLAEAVDRLCREYPSTRDGLSLTERRILAATAGHTGTPDSRRPLAHEVFSRAAEREARPFLGDTWAFAAMDRLARARVPLLVGEPGAGPVAATSAVALTQTGMDVLAGCADHMELNDIDRWVGGVALNGHSSWRFDEGTETILGSG